MSDLIMPLVPALDKGGEGMGATPQTTEILRCRITSHLTLLVLGILTLALLGLRCKTSQFKETKSKGEMEQEEFPPSISWIPELHRQTFGFKLTCLSIPASPPISWEALGKLPYS